MKPQSSLGDLTFQCQLDGGGYSNCTSPHQEAGLAVDPHTFEVRATDEAGNEESTASFSWTVNPASTCTPPNSGTWTITTSCIMSASATAPGNVLVQNNAVLTIPAGITLDINFGSFNLTVKSGGGVLVKSGGTIT